jgi:hypothetical protein
MPSTVTYANRHSHEIANTIDDFEDEASDNDSSYVDSEENNESLMSNSDDDTADDSSSDGDPNDDNGFDGGQLYFPNVNSVPS